MVYNSIIVRGSSLSVIDHIGKDIMSITNTLRTLFFFFFLTLGVRVTL